MLISNNYSVNFFNIYYNIKKQNIKIQKNRRKKLKN